MTTPSPYEIKSRTAWTLLTGLVVLCLLGGAGCLHMRTEHRYTVNVHGALYNGETNQPIKGLFVKVSVGDTVVYDGLTDESGGVEFTYSWIMNEDDWDGTAGDTDNPGVTVVFQVEVQGYGILEFPVTIGDGTKTVSMGKLTFRPTP